MKGTDAKPARKFGGYKNPADYRRYMREYQRKNRAKLSDQARARRETKPDIYNEQARQYRKRNRDKINENRARTRKIAGLITPAEYDVLLARQDGACAICRTIRPRKISPGHTLRRTLSVDHDHKTRKPRGLLCHHCNAAIGHFKEDTTVLAQAIEYLIHHKAG